MVNRPKAPVALSGAQQWFVSWTVDLLLYTVVLNLFDQYVHGVTIESFSVSILTAVLLKVMLVLLAGVEHRVHAHFAEKGTTGAKVVGAVLVFAILFGGKLLILEVVDIVFGDTVDLGHFVEVVALILTMMVSRRLLDWVFRSLERKG